MPNDGRPFRTAIQMIDTDRLCDPQDRTVDPKIIRRGVERDMRGAPIAHYIRMAHASDYNDPLSTKWKRVPIRKSWGRLQMLHIYEQNRPDQSRGVSAMVSALKEMRMTKKFRDVMLQNAVLNATYAASIESDLPPEAAFAALGGKDENPIASYAADYLGAIDEFSGGSKNMTVDGVKIPHLFPGTKLQLRPAGPGGPLGGEFEKSLLRYIAASLNVSYEQLSRDYTATNYSSARAAMNETWKGMLSRKKLVADRFASFIFRLWLEEAINRGELESLKRKNIPSFYDGLNADAYSSCEWIGAGRGQIDELKETQAAVLRLKYRLSTREVEIARLSGGDWRKVARQNRREIDLDEAYNLPALQVDPNMENALAASPQDSQAAA
jgi:lambda family phage portal protein